jgi:uncharacterized protein YpmB
MENLETPKTENNFGAIIGIILIILMLLVGAYFFLSQRITKLEEQRQANALLRSEPATTTIYIRIPATSTAKTQ